MPIRFLVQPGDHIVRVTYTGTITLMDLSRHVQRLLTSNLLDRPRLVDSRNATFRLTGEDIRIFSRRLSSPPWIRIRGTCASSAWRYLGGAAPESKVHRIEPRQRRLLPWTAEHADDRGCGKPEARWDHRIPGGVLVVQPHLPNQWTSRNTCPCPRPNGALPVRRVRGACMRPDGPGRSAAELEMSAVEHPPLPRSA